MHLGPPICSRLRTNTERRAYSLRVVPELNGGEITRGNDDAVNEPSLIWKSTRFNERDNSATGKLLQGGCGTVLVQGTKVERRTHVEKAKRESGVFWKHAVACGTVSQMVKGNSGLPIPGGRCALGVP